MEAPSNSAALPQFVTESYCLRCQGCCRFAQADTVWVPQLLASEKQALGKIRLVADPHSGSFRCCFLNPSENSCKVYSLRPLDCQLYPFLLNRRGDKVFLAVDPACMFIKEKKDSPQFEAFVKRLGRMCTRGRLAEVVARNPHLAQRYETVLDLVELNVPV